MMDLSKFNPQQKEAITSTKPYIKVIAGAGSGKTAVLTNRIAYLIQERHVNEKKILAITFTNKAAKEMKERVLKQLEQEYFNGLITTFHSFCLRVLKEDINILGYTNKFNIIDSDDQKSVLKTLNKNLMYDKEIFKVKSIIAYISNKKNNYSAYAIDSSLVKVYDEFYNEYELYLKQHNSLDFDDLILKCVELFKTNQMILDKWRFRFNYIHVDEFQDTNYQQYELIRLLATDLNVFVVGDPDQTIYTWRGAKTSYILNFETDFQDTQTIKLEHNYRSKAHILECANSIIVNNSERIDKKLIATRESTQKVEHYIGYTSDDEANFVVDKINELVNNVEGVNYDDFAILYRSNYISRSFEQYLTKANIDYQIIGGTRFFERKEIKDVIAYLKLISFEDDLSFLRVINTPKRKLGDKSVDKIMSYAHAKKVSYYEAVLHHLDEIKLSATQKKAINAFTQFIEQAKENDDTANLIESITNTFDLLEEYDENSIEYQRRKDNVDELHSYAQQESSLLDDFLQNIVLDTNDENEDGAKVSLMSMHGAKGLEFKYVFAVFMCDGIFPSSYNLESLNIEEERRLAYVCFTRAKEQLFLVSHSKKDDFNRMKSSMFIDEIEHDLLDKSGSLEFNSYTQAVYEKPREVIKYNNHNETFQRNDLVLHPLYKKGIVVAINDNVLTIAFENKIGIKQIVSDFVRKV